MIKRPVEVYKVNSCKLVWGLGPWPPGNFLTLEGLRSNFRLLYCIVTDKITG